MLELVKLKKITELGTVADTEELYTLTDLLMATQANLNWFKVIMKEWERTVDLTELSEEAQEVIKDLYGLFNFKTKFVPLEKTKYDFTIFKKSTDYIAERFLAINEEFLAEVITRFPEEAAANIIANFKEKTKTIEQPEDLTKFKDFFEVAVFSLNCLDYKFIHEKFNENNMLNLTLKYLFALIESDLLSKKLKL